MSRSAEYVLSTYSFISTYPVDKILDVGFESKDGNPIPSFDEDLLIELCNDAQKIFEKESNILEISSDVIIVGDIHGSLHDLLRILKYAQESNSKVLFLGDYVDRGSFSIECITILFALKIMKPEKYFLIRGNHEFDVICRNYGFYDEIMNYNNRKNAKKYTELHQQYSLKPKDFFLLNLNQENNAPEDANDSTNNNFEEYYSSHKDMDCYNYTENLYHSFIKTFSYLPIAAVVNKTNLCIHGGLSPILEKVDQIENEIKRPISNFEENRLLSDIVWSDPSASFTFLYSNNPRGQGCLFNQNAAFEFLNLNSFKRLIRGNECVKNGIFSQFHDRCITVFSASSYSKKVDNDSGIIKLFQHDDTIENIIFSPTCRLEKSEAVYYKVQSLLENNNKKEAFFSFRHPQLSANPSYKNIKIRKRVRQSLSPQNYLNPLVASPQRTNNASIRKASISHSSSIGSLASLNSPSKIKKRRIRNLDSLSDLPHLNNHDVELSILTT